MQEGLKKPVLMAVSNELKRRGCVYMEVGGRAPVQGMYLYPEALLSNSKESWLIWDQTTGLSFLVYYSRASTFHVKKKDWCSLLISCLKK